MSAQCPLGGPRCPEAICDCFIEQFPNDPAQALALHPEFFIVEGIVGDPAVPAPLPDDELLR